MSTKTIKFTRVDNSTKKATELSFYNIETPITAFELFDMFHTFCMAIEIPEATWLEEMRLRIDSSVPKPPMGGSTPVDSIPS
jgi:hypothetical protein